MVISIKMKIIIISKAFSKINNLNKKKISLALVEVSLMMVMMISLVVDSEILWEEWEEWGEWVEWEDLAVWEWVVWVECNSSPQCLVAVICVEVAEHQKVFKLQLL